MNSDLSIQTLELLNLRLISNHVDGMEGVGKDAKGKGLVKRLVKSFLPPIPTDARLGPHLKVVNVEWLSKENGGTNGTIRSIGGTYFGRGDSVWVTNDPTGSLNAGIVRVIVESLVQPDADEHHDPADYYHEGKEQRSNPIKFRVEIQKIIPMQELCSYFRAEELRYDYYEYFSDCYDRVVTSYSHPQNNVVQLIRDPKRPIMFYKQVDGTWYRLLDESWDFDPADRWDDANYFRLRVLSEDELERLLGEIQEQLEGSSLEEDSSLEEHSSMEEDY